MGVELGGTASPWHTQGLGSVLSVTGIKISEFSKTKVIISESLGLHLKIVARVIVHLISFSRASQALLKPMLSEPKKRYFQRVGQHGGLRSL